MRVIDPKSGQASRRTPKQAFADEDYYSVVADASPHCEEVSARAALRPERNVIAWIDNGAMGELTLQMRRVLPAAPPVVFHSFSDPDELAKWWGPQGFTVPSLDFDPRVGGSYRIEMQPPEGDPFHLTGRFREVDPPVGLAYTFIWENPDPDDVETLVELSLRALGESTEVGLTQGHFKTEARRELHHGGWTDSFDKLEQLLSQA